MVPWIHPPLCLLECGAASSSGAAASQSAANRERGQARTDTAAMPARATMGVRSSSNPPSSRDGQRAGPALKHVSMEIPADLTHMQLPPLLQQHRINAGSFNQLVESVNKLNVAEKGIRERSKTYNACHLQLRRDFYDTRDRINTDCQGAMSYVNTSEAPTKETETQLQSLGDHCKDITDSRPASPVRLGRSQEPTTSCKCCRPPPSRSTAPGSERAGFIY